MSEEESLYKKAYKYYSKGKELDAISSYKLLLEKYPLNVNGWSEMATMQYEICDYDQAIISSKKAIQLEPENSLHLNNYITRLSLLKKLTFESPNLYLNESTKEAFKIDQLTGINTLYDEIENYTKKYIELNKDKPSYVHSAYRRIGNNAIRIGQFEKGIKYLKIALTLKDHRKNRSDPTPSILLQISNGYLGLKDFNLAHKYIDEGFVNGLDDFCLLKKANIYKQQSLNKDHDSTIKEFIKRVNSKLQTNPESAYFNQKIKALLEIKNYTQAEKTLLEYEVLMPYSPYEIENLEKQRILIEKEKTDNNR